MNTQSEYLDAVYAGLIGKCVGVRLGAPVEPEVWTYERIKEVYGDITGYVKDYKNFAADDDLNGPVYFFRAMRDSSRGGEITPEYVARAWLNYAREGIGMFWWGGYGNSTCHTTYTNLSSGINAPMSGSEQVNGKTLSEQIGGQIFIDVWGLMWLGNPEKAADYAEAAASVSHDGESLNGARFIAACIALAYKQSCVQRLVEEALKFIPEDSVYSRVVRAVIDHYEGNHYDWRSCIEMLQRDWGYDKYPGACPIIPNAGVCALAMLYGGGVFSRTVEIATMCGWDTDCNAGSVGTVLGVMCGVRGILDCYREPINDGIVLSGISGYLNILDIPTFAKEVAATRYWAEGKDVPLDVRVVDGEINFDFMLPGSTHNFRTNNSNMVHLKHSDYMPHTLEVVLDGVVRGNSARVFYKPFYTRADFSDDRYRPVFSPKVCSGQRVYIHLYFEPHAERDSVVLVPYVRTASDKAVHRCGATLATHYMWRLLSFEVPDVGGDIIDEVGLLIEGDSPATAPTHGRVFIGSFAVRGASDYTIDMSKQRKEFEAITPFSMNHGAWSIEGSRMHMLCCRDSIAYTGNYYAKDMKIGASVYVYNGDSAVLVVRARGAMQSYMAGFKGGKACIWRQDFGMALLSSTKFDIEDGRRYTLEFEVAGEELTFKVDGKVILTAEDSVYTYGMVGLGSLDVGRCSFGDIRIKEV